MTIRRGLAATLIAALTFGPAPFPAAAQDRPVVFVDSYPLAYFAERLAGEEVEVVLPAPEGRDPSFWKPSIAEIGMIQAADLILLNGAGFADWTTRASLPRARTVDTSRGFTDDYIVAEGVTHSHGADGEHSHEATASYTWLDLDQASTQAAAVAEALRRLTEVPADLDARLAALRADLAALSQEAKALGPLAEGRDLIGSHPRYQYLARAYGLEVASVEWDPGAMPDAAQLEALHLMAAEARAPVFLWEAEPPAEAREALAAMGIPDAVVPTLAGRPAGGDFVRAFADGIAELAEALGTPDTDG